ncbi:MAG: DUF2089 family protein [Candidatus Hydrogenedentes bacterium]|nr:DUF2089 family protein [Candidatus Hydrogenedentota bacterium]
MDTVESPPAWVTALGDDELLFLKRFLLASGSLKELAAVYGVTYPTIRNRLDRLIDRVNAVEASASDDAFEALINTLVEQGVMVSGTGRALLQTHKRILRETAERAERNTATSVDEWQA